MSSIQERLQMKRVPLDKWSTKEKLCLASSVACSGDQNWMSVSRSLKLLCGANRPNDWFAQKSCAAQYGKLLENVETPKRKKRTASDRDGVAAVETPGESILRKLTQERVIELKKTIQEESQHYIKVKEDIILIQSGVTDEKKLREMWKQIEHEKAQKENEEIQHAQWLKEREEKKLELERQWRPMYPNSPTATKAPTPPMKIKDETDEDSQGSSKSATSPLLTSLLKHPNAGQVASPPTATVTPGRSIASPTITNLLTGTAGITSKSSLTAATDTSDNVPAPHPVNVNKQETLATTTTGQSAEVKEPKVLSTDDSARLRVCDPSVVDISSSVQPNESDSIKSEALFGEMDSEDNADPAKDLMDVLEDLIPHDLDEILKENSGMILEDVDLKNVVESIMEAEDVPLKDKDIETVEGSGDVPMAEAAGEHVNETASKNEDILVESIKSPPVTSPSPMVATDAKTSTGDIPSTSQTNRVVDEKVTGFQSQNVPEQAITQVSVKQDDKAAEIGMEIIPIEDSTSNSPATIPSSDDNKDPAEDSSVQENLESVIVVSDSAKEEEDDDDNEGDRSETPKDAPTPAEDDDSDDKPLASLDVMTEDNKASLEKTIAKVEDEKMSTQPPVLALDEARPATDLVVAQKEVMESIKVEVPQLPADEAKAKKEAMEKLAAEYDFKDDEEPIVPLSIQKAKEEKHVSEDEVFEDAQDTVEEPDDVKDLEPPARKVLPDDSVLTVTDTDDDSLIEMKIGKAKRDYSRRKQADEAQKLRDELPGHSKSDETEGRSLRKLRDRDRSESPFVMLDDEPNEKMKRSYSSTPVMDSIPGSPASSEDRDYRAWKKSILAVYSRIAAKNAAAFLKPLPEDQTAHLLYRPMDLGQIKRNIENGNIRTTAEFQRDIMLMCTNAIMLNRSDLCSPHAARMLMRESISLIEAGMDPKAGKERDSERNTHKRSSRKSATRHSTAGRN